MEPFDESGWSVPTDELVRALESLVASESQAKLRLAELVSEYHSRVVAAAVAAAIDVGAIKVVGVEVDDADVNGLRDVATQIRNNLGESVVLAGSKLGDKAQLVLAVSKGLVGRGMKAPDMIRPIAQIVGGSGGGRPDMAQAGGADSAQLGTAIATLADVVRRQINQGETK